MNSNLIDILIIELKSELKKKYNDFIGIYFFGSRVKGDFIEESDIDMVFTFNRKIDRRFKDEIRSLIYDYDLKYDVVIDSHIYSQNDILNPITPFRANIKNFGIFYGA